MTRDVIVFAVEDGTWIMLLLFTALFIVDTVLLSRRGSSNTWFIAFAASALPLLAAIYPCIVRLHVASHSGEYLDGDPSVEIALAKRVWTLGLVLSAILAGMGAYGYFRRQKT